MPRYAQLVMGPAGSGKSTYCATMVQHCEALGRAVQVVNLDPAAELFSYPVMAGERPPGTPRQPPGLNPPALCGVPALQRKGKGPGGPGDSRVSMSQHWALVARKANGTWGGLEGGGQIELYTHLPVMKQLVEQLQQWEFRVCGVFLVDSQFMVESFKFISGILAALSAMISLEIPQINIMTKMDLLSKKAKKEIEKYLDPDMYSMIEDSTNILKSKMFKKLTKSICGLIDDYGMVRFLPFDRSDEESINIVLQHIDFTIQYGEDLEFKEPKECEEDKSALVDEYFQDHVDE
ncbi:GPN3 GTPase, partial [Columbina picui]|nr:GPN3 GTPase [Columbina picui]